MKVVFLLAIFTLLTGCTTNKFTGNNASQYERLTCTLEEIPCRINYGEDGYISYSVDKLGPTQYKVSGEVSLYKQISSGKRPSISFYVLFMDDNVVQFERKMKTGTRKATFEFEVETPVPISKTTIEKVIFHYWS